MVKPPAAQHNVSPSRHAPTTGILKISSLLAINWTVFCLQADVLGACNSITRNHILTSLGLAESLWIVRWGEAGVMGPAVHDETCREMSASVSQLLLPLHIAALPALLTGNATLVYFLDEGGNRGRRTCCMFPPRGDAHIRHAYVGFPLTRT